MIVEELIKELQKWPNDLEVFIEANDEMPEKITIVCVDRHIFVKTKPALYLQGE